MATHLEESLQRDIDRIRSKITNMAELGERALKDCVKALLERNRQLAYSIILRDQRIDELEQEIDRLCLEFLVRQQPVAGHLRFAYATIKVNLELERVGDYAESIARQILKISSMNFTIATERFVEISDLSIPMLRNAVLAFVSQDAELARDTMATEEIVDALKSKINSELVQLRQEEKIPLEALNPLMTVARRFERVSDQARNICEETVYMCTGEYAKHKGAEATRILFVDEHNSCRSQMAEGIGNSLGQPQFIFSSAGLDPRPVDPTTVRVLKEKGIDISRQTSKAVAQVPNFDHYHIIVSLAKEAEKVFPRPPHKTVCLDWAVPDPSKARGTPQEINAAYQTTYREIRAHILDLVEAIVGTKTS